MLLNAVPGRDRRARARVGSGRRASRSPASRGSRRPGSSRRCCTTSAASRTARRRSCCRSSSSRISRWRSTCRSSPPLLVGHRPRRRHRDRRWSRWRRSSLILYVALRHGQLVSRLVWSRNAEVLLLSVLGLTLLVAGLAAQASVSAAVGAFLVGIAISGPVAAHAERVLTPLRDLFASVFFLFFGLSTDPADLVPMLDPRRSCSRSSRWRTKVLTGYLAARKAGIGEAGRWRAGFALTPRGRVLDRHRRPRGRRRGRPTRSRRSRPPTCSSRSSPGPLLARMPDSRRFARLDEQAACQAGRTRRAARRPSRGDRDAEVESSRLNFI